MAAKKRAVVIGVNRYKDPKIPELSGAVNDAEELRRSLQDFGEFQIEDSHFLIDQQATCASILKAVSDLLWRPDPCDLALLYFSGHGFVDRYENGYIAPHDMIRDEPLVYGIDMADLKRLVLRAVHPGVVMILDCCHSGIPTEEKTRGILDHPEKSLDLVFGSLGDDPGGEGKFILASSEGDQVSRENPSCLHLAGGQPHPHGAFSYHLIEGLSGKASSDPSGKITLDKLVGYVESQIVKQGKQKPRFYTSGASRMNLMEIARSPEKFHDYIAGLLEKTAALVKMEGGPINLIDAMKNIHRLLEDAKDRAEVQDLSQRIGAKWAQMQQKAIVFISENIADLSRELPKTKKRIEDLADLSRPREIAGLDRESEAILLHLCEVSLGLKPTERFIRYCRNYETQPDPGTLSPGIRP